MLGPQAKPTAGGASSSCGMVRPGAPPGAPQPLARPPAGAPPCDRSQASLTFSAVLGPTLRHLLQGMAGWGRGGSDDASPHGAQAIAQRLLSHRPIPCSKAERARGTGRGSSAGRAGAAAARSPQLRERLSPVGVQHSGSSLAVGGQH